jgi:predicted RNase H-like nuclease (RuvC/YqgF family)
VVEALRLVGLEHEGLGVVQMTPDTHALEQELRELRSTIDEQRRRIDDLVRRQVELLAEISAFSVECARLRQRLRGG